METEVEVYCKKDKKKDCSCLCIITTIVGIILSFFLGVLVENLANIVIALGLGAVIVLIITLAILLIMSLISLFCCKKNDKKKKNCCCC